MPTDQPETNKANPQEPTQDKRLKTYVLLLCSTLLLIILGLTFWQKKSVPEYLERYRFQGGEKLDRPVIVVLPETFNATLLDQA